MKILGTGLSGLVGSRIVELLTPHHSFINFSLENGVDITNRNDITQRIIRENEAPWVFHMAAYTNVQQAEFDRAQGTESPAWKVNVTATEYIVEACSSSGKKLLYVDTDYAFDGTKEEYNETDIPNPISWYGITKSEGAKRVLTMGKNGLVIRIANPYRAHPIGKVDFVHKMMERLKNDEEIAAPFDQLFVPTFIDDIASALELLLQQNAFGIYHVVGSDALSPYDAALQIAQMLKIPSPKITSTTFAHYFADRAPIPQKAVLRNKKLLDIGGSMRSFSEGLGVMIAQES
jgi:dTDP-4-dehydrorhamnose reductase